MTLCQARKRHDAAGPIGLGDVRCWLRWGWKLWRCVNVRRKCDREWAGIWMDHSQVSFRRRGFVQPFETADPGRAQIAVIVEFASLTVRIRVLCAKSRTPFTVWGVTSRDFLSVAQKASLFYGFRHETIRCYKFNLTTMFVPHMPSRPADIYTIRISDHEAQTSLAMSLRKLVTAAGGTFMINLMEGPGFVYVSHTNK